MGDALAEIQTDKATLTFEAPEDGYIAKILLKENETRPVNHPIAILVENEEDIAAVKDYDPTQAKSAPAAPKQESNDAPAPKEENTQTQSTSVKSGDRVFASPYARKVADEKGYDITDINGTGIWLY